jgi:excinuclease ABC subunit B
MKPAALAKAILKLEQQMYEHAKNLEFEDAARLRDEIEKIQNAGLGMGLDHAAQRGGR